METLMAYFGKFTAAEAGKLANFQFEYLTTLGFAAIVIFLGRFIVSKSKALQKYAIPAPVVFGTHFLPRDLGHQGCRHHGVYL